MVVPVRPDTQAYAWWHPVDHVSSAWVVPEDGGVIGSKHLVEERLTDLPAQALTIQFCDPEAFFTPRELPGPFASNNFGRFLLAAERFEKAGKKPGDRKGPLGAIAIEVLRELLRLVDHRTGRLDPTITTLMARTLRSKNSVVRGLQALRRHGFLDWVRRCELTGNLGKGPQVRQTSNAYRLTLPPAAARLLGRAAFGAPVPEDLEHAREARLAAFEAALIEAEPEERNGVFFGTGPLADAFSRLERAVCVRRSASLHLELKPVSSLKP